MARFGFKLRAAFRLLRADARSPSIKSATRSEEHTSELQSHLNLVCRLLLEKKKNRYKLHETLKVKDILVIKQYKRVCKKMVMCLGENRIDHDQFDIHRVETMHTLYHEMSE